MQPKGYIKDIKWLGESLEAYSIKMQYEIVFKSDRWCSCYTCLPQSSPTAQATQKMMAASGTGAPLVAQRLLTNTWPKTRQQHKHTSKQMLTLRNSTLIHKNSTLK